jgi:hypothetical protein
MIERGGSWITGLLERPFGRGINFQIDVPDVSTLKARLVKAGWPLFRDVEDV